MTLTEVILLALTLVGSLGIFVWRFQVHRRLSIVGTVFAIAFLQYGVMCIPYGLGYAHMADVSVPISREYPWFFIQTFGGFTAGAVLMAGILQLDIPTAQEKFFNAQIPVEDAADRSFYFSLLVPAVLIALAYVFAQGTSGFEMLLSAAGNYDKIREFRLGFYDQNPYQYAGSIVNNSIGPILLLTALNTHAISRRPMWRLVSLGLFATLFLTATAALHKAPVVVLILHVLVNRFIRTGEARRLVRFAVPALAILVPLIVVGFVVTYGQGTSAALESTGMRIFVAPIVGVHAFLFVYPDVLPFNNGLGIGLLAKIYGVQYYVNPPVVVGQIVAGPNVVLDCIWSSEMWAAWGDIGVLLGSVAVGALIVSLEWWCLRQARSTTSIATYAFLIVVGIAVPELSIFTVLLSGGLVIGPTVARFLEGRRNWLRASS